MQDKARILVADDDPATRYALARAVRADGHEVVEVATGHQALQAVRTMRPELLVLDVRLPDLLGYEVAERLRAAPATSSIAILQVSASYTRADAQAEGLMRGADAYLTLPVDPAVLSATIQALLRMRRAEQREKEARAQAQAIAEEAREISRERERVVRQLREEAARREEFLAMLSHELRNPLMPIKNSIFVLQRAEPGGEQAKRALRVLERQATQMSRLVDDLLDASRIARGKLAIRRDSIEFGGVLRRALEDHQALFREAGVELRVSVADDPVRVHGDATRLAQMVGSLLQNAAKFTPAGGHVHVSLALNASGGAVFQVSDTGVGIREELVPRVFEPFVQEDAALDRSRGGLGLGLALAHGIVQLHGGSISVESAGVDRGSVFSVRLPVEALPPSPAPGSANTVAECPRRILIIEDNHDSAETLREALELCAHVVDIAHDGTEGIAKARILRPEVILCDIGLPGMDGYALARCVREDPLLRSTLLVALTGYALPEDVARCRQAGFDRHIAKPPRLEELERVFAALSSRG